MSALMESSVAFKASGNVAKQKEITLKADKKGTVRSVTVIPAGNAGATGAELFVREDGRLNLSVREKAHVQMLPDMEKILKLLQEYGGVLPFTEKADPEVIRRETWMSKNEFKRAVGHLYKERRIQINDGKIRLVKE